MDFANGFGFFFSKVIAGLSTSFVGLFDHLINNPVGYLPVIGFDAGVDRHRRRSRVSAFHNGLYDRYFSQQVYAVFLGEAAALDPAQWQRIGNISRACDYLELSGRADFAAAFTDDLSFPQP